MPYPALYINTDQRGYPFKRGEMWANSYIAHQRNTVMALYACQQESDAHERQTIVDILVESGKVAHVGAAHNALEVDEDRWPRKQIWALGFVGETLSTPSSSRSARQNVYDSCSPRATNARFGHFTLVHAVPLRHTVPLIQDDGTRGQARPGSAGVWTHLPYSTIPWSLLTGAQTQAVLRSEICQLATKSC